MCVLILFSLYSNYMLRYMNIKKCFQRGFEFIKKFFGTLVLASYCYCGDNTKKTDFSQNTGFKEISNMEFQQSQSNDKLSRKVMSSSYHIKQITFIEVSCTNNIHTGEKGFSEAVVRRCSVRKVYEIVGLKPPTLI